MKRPDTILGKLKQFCCLVLALHFLNFSMDAKDPRPDNIPEDLSLNDIESITEFLAEVVFEWNNAFEEHDEKDSEDGSSIFVIKFYFGNCPLQINQDNYLLPIDPKYILEQTNKISSRSMEVNSPPPKA